MQRTVVVYTMSDGRAVKLAILLQDVFSIEAHAVDSSTVAVCHVDNAHAIYMFAQGYLIGVEQA